MWYRVSLRDTESGERTTIEIEARTGRSARREVLRALPMNSAWIVESIDPLDRDTSDGDFIIFWALVTGATIIAAVILLH